MGEEQKQQVDDKPRPESNADQAPKQSNTPNQETNNEGQREQAKQAPDSGEDKDNPSPPPPPPPEEFIMRVYMHCEGCARKVHRCLRACDGVEEVVTDCRAHKVVVKGKVAAADPLKVVERLQRKTGRKVELLTPVPPKPEEKKAEKVEIVIPKLEEKEEPPVISVVLKVHMHCEACSQEIKKRILKLKGAESVDADLKASEVTVTGVFDAPTLVEYVHRRTGKHAVLVKQEVVGKKPSGDVDRGSEGETKDEKSEVEGDKDKGEGGDGGGGEMQQCEDLAAAAMAAKLMEMRRNEMFYHYYYPRYQVEYAYPPQMFSDENPNACSVM